MITRSKQLQPIWHTKMRLLWHKGCFYYYRVIIPLESSYGLITCCHTFTSMLSYYLYIHTHFDLVCTSSTHFFSTLALFTRNHARARPRCATLLNVVEACCWRRRAVFVCTCDCLRVDFVHLYRDSFMIGSPFAHAHSNAMLRTAWKGAWPITHTGHFWCASGWVYTMALMVIWCCIVCVDSREYYITYKKIWVY